MRMTRWDKIKLMWALFLAPRDAATELTAKEAESLRQGLEDLRNGDVVSLDDVTQGAANPYLEAEEADAVYETLEHGLHAVWPLVNANEYGGTLAARGVLWGTLYTFTLNEDERDQRGVAWELATLVRDYLPEDQDPMQLPGVRPVEGEDEDLFTRLTQEQKPGVHRIEGELSAFMDAALTGNYEAAANVTNALRTRLGAVVQKNYDTLEDAEKAMFLNFTGSCLASLASMYGELLLEETGTRD